MIKTVLLTLFVTAALGVCAAVAVVNSGAYDVAATTPHWSATTWLLDTARLRSIQSHAAGITAPPGIDEQAKIMPAVGHFAAHCATCHGAPGIDRSEFAGGMYPRPPDLTKVSQRYTPAELFWILKNGIKMTGMPSMADDGDDMLWATVGLLEKLPGMTPEAFGGLVTASRVPGSGHHHAAGIEMQRMDMHGMSMGGDANEQTDTGGHPAAVGPQPAGDGHQEHH
jgi:mono/diheme cytochrome c family protein